MPSGFTGITILKDFGGQIDLNSYDPEADDYLINFNTTDPSKIFTSLNGPGLYDISFGGTTGSARVRAFQPNSPVRSPPTFPTNNTITVTAVVSGKSSSVTVILQPPPTLQITSTPAIPSGGVRTNGVSITGLRVTNLNAAASVTTRLQVVGSASSFQAGGSTLYSDFTKGEVFSLSGLTPNTRYAAPSLTVTNTKNNMFVSFTMGQGFTTLALPTLPATGSIYNRFIGVTTNSVSGRAAATAAPNAGLPISVSNANSQLALSTNGAFNILNFNGMDKGMATSIASSTTRTRFSVVIVFRLRDIPRNGWGGAYQLFNNRGAFPAGSIHVALYEAGLVIATPGGAFSGVQNTGDPNNWYPYTGMDDNTRYTFILSVDTSTGIFRSSLNGDKRSVTTSVRDKLFSGETALYIGCTSGGDRKLNANLGEFIFYDNYALSDAEMTQVDTYMNAFYM